MKLGFDALCRVLSALTHGRSVTYCPNLGNAGDGTICAATWNLFDRCSISPGPFESGHPPKLAEDEIFIYGGGGNLVPMYDHAARVLQAALDRPYRAIILLPHTVRGQVALLEQMDERCHLICRETVAYHHVRRFAPRAKTYLADDLALALNPRDVLSPEWMGSARRRLSAGLGLAASKRRRRRLVRWTRDIRAMRRCGDSLRIMRSDEESAGRPGPLFPSLLPPTPPVTEGLDLSALYQSNFNNRIEAEWITRDFFGVLAQAKQIETDRLHVALCASLLGKDVVLRDNHYGKNRAVFEFSLREAFPRTRFAD